MAFGFWLMIGLICGTLLAVGLRLSLETTGWRKRLLLPTTAEIVRDTVERPVWSAWRLPKPPRASIWYTLDTIPAVKRAMNIENCGMFYVECFEADFPKVFSKLTREGLTLLAEVRTIPS